MGCTKCDGYWVCEPGEDPLCEAVEDSTPPWTPAGTQTVPAGMQGVWCRPGCDAVIADTKPSPWQNAGEIEFEAATYELFCQTSGGGNKCLVKVEKVS